MPKTHRAPRPPDPAAWKKKLARLPRRAGLVIEGGKRPLSLYIRENRKTVQPQLALWLQANDGFVRGVRVISPAEGGDAGVAEALDVLVQAMTSPTPVPGVFGRGPERGLPEKVLVNEPSLAEAARDLLTPLDVSVEYVERLPAFEDAFQDLSAALGAREDGPPEPFEWDIDEALLPPLYTAAANYWRQAPWEYLGSDLPISVELGRYGPQPGVDTLYAVPLGNAGEVFGVAFYFSLEAFERTMQSGMERMVADVSEDVGEGDEIDSMIEMMRQMGAPVDEVPPEELRRMVGEMMKAQGLSTGGQGGEVQMNDEEFLSAIEDSMVVYFDTKEESDPFYIEWLTDGKLMKHTTRDAVPSFHRLVERTGPARPGREEVLALTVAVQALSQFFSAKRSAILRRYPPDFIVLPSAATDRIEHIAVVKDPQERGKQLEVRVSLPAEGYLP